MHTVELLEKRKIILGIIVYIILGELSKEVIIFPVVEPMFIDRFESSLAERFTEFSEYLLLATILVPVSIYFIINPVNQSNSTLIRLSSEAQAKNSELSLEIAERKRVEEEREALIHDLEEALHEIKTLKGIIPICSYCKTIRNDKGSWIGLEKYIEENSDAEFTHSICDDCLEKLYPEKADS